MWHSVRAGLYDACPSQLSNIVLFSATLVDFPRPHPDAPPHGKLLSFTNNPLSASAKKAIGDKGASASSLTTWIVSYFDGSEPLGPSRPNSGASGSSPTNPLTQLRNDPVFVSDRMPIILQVRFLYEFKTRCFSPLTLSVA